MKMVFFLIFPLFLVFPNFLFCDKILSDYSIVYSQKEKGGILLKEYYDRKLFISQIINNPNTNFFITNSSTSDEFYFHFTFLPAFNDLSLCCLSIYALISKRTERSSKKVPIALKINNYSNLFDFYCVLSLSEMQIYNISSYSLESNNEQIYIGYSKITFLFVET